MNNIAYCIAVAILASGILIAGSWIKFRKGEKARKAREAKMKKAVERVWGEPGDMAVDASGRLFDVSGSFDKMKRDWTPYD